MKLLTVYSSTVLILALALISPLAFAAESQKVININNASASQLTLLPRVGPALSARILEFREANGKFKEAGDLMLVRGIGEKTFALMRPFVAVSGETTLTEKVRATQAEAASQSAAAEPDTNETPR